MLFGVALTPVSLLSVLFVAFFAMLAPMLIIEEVSKSLSEPWRSVVMVLGAYIVWPLIVAWLYKVKLRKSGTGSVIFYFYAGLYCLMFIIFLIKIFTGVSNGSDYLGVLVLGSVSGGLIWFALKTRKQLSNDIAQAQIEMYEDERAEDIQRQAEAILLAEEMKKKRNRT